MTLAWVSSWYITMKKHPTIMVLHPVTRLGTQLSNWVLSLGGTLGGAGGDFGLERLKKVGPNKNPVINGDRYKWPPINGRKKIETIINSHIGNWGLFHPT